MRQFLSFVRKEFQHILRDRRTMLIVLLMPVVQMILFGFAVSTEINNARVMIAGDMSDSVVKKIAERIDRNKYLEVVGWLSSVSEADARFRKNRTDVVVCFEQDFGRKLIADGHADVKIIGDGSDPNTSQMITGYVNGVIQTEQAEITGNAGGRVAVSPSVQLEYNPAMKSSYNFVPGVMGLIMMLICATMTSISIVREKETGTMELLFVSPVKPLWIVVSKAMPYMVISAINFLTIMLLARYVMDVPIRGSLGLLTLVVVVFVLTCLSLGLLISVIAKTQRTALLLAGMGLMMPTVIFSGIIFPCESMPAAVQWISHIMPAKWFVIMVRKVMIQGSGFDHIIKEFTILAGMMLFLLTVSIKKFKIRL